MKANDSNIVSFIITVAMGVGFMIGAISVVDYIKMMCNENGSFRIGSDSHYSCEVVK